MKRFTVFSQVINLSEPFTPVKDKNEPISLMEVVNLLNQFHEENQELKEKNIQLKTEREELMELLKHSYELLAGVKDD